MNWEGAFVKRLGILLVVMALSISMVACGAESIPGAEAVEDITSNIGSASAKENKVGSRDNSIEVLKPEISGIETYGNDQASIDASNSADGYVCVAYKGDASKVRMLIETPAGNTYNYLMDLDGNYDVYPLSEGNGTYTIGVYENIQGDQYSVAFSTPITVQLKDEYTTFLYPNAYVDFSESSAAVKKGAELAASADTDLDVVTAVYHYIAKNISYDHDKAATVQSGYIPTVDDTLASGTGICFDYASLAGAMLRSQRIPTRLEIGYAGTEYHAWISVYIKDQGWIDDIIEFDGKNWILMDPTLASYAKKSTIKEHWQSNSYYQLMYKY